MSAAAEQAASAPGEREGQALCLNGLHLLALWAFALVQPLFDLLGRNADFFVARGSESGDIVAFALAVTLIPPALLFAIEALVGLVSLYARDWVHVIFIGLLTAIIALGFIKKIFDSSSAVLMPVALAIGIAAAVWYESEQTVRTFVTVLAAAPPLFLFLFLFTSPVHELVLTGEAKAEAARVDSKTPVVMISFDEFPVTSLERPDGSIDAVRYPNFARLATQATWFRNATTVADGTRWATPIVISGVLPKKDALPTFQDYPQNLFTALGGGYRLHVTEPVTRLCPKNLCSDTGPREVEAGDVAGTAGPDSEHEDFGKRMSSMFSDLGIVSLHLVLPNDLRKHLPSVSEQLGNFGAQNKAPAALPAAPRAAPGGTAAQRERRRRATGRRLTELIPIAKQAEQARPAFPRFIEQIKPYSGVGKPPLYYMHILLPHHPWHYLPSGRTYNESLPEIPGLRDNIWNSDDVAVNQGWQRHLLQVGYVDREVGALIARLKATGLWNRALVVFASDHGVAFAPSSPRRRITAQDVGGIAPIPFFMKLPKETRGKVIDDHVQTSDILPTIADALNFALPKRSDGSSALRDDFKPVDTVKIWSTTSTEDFSTVEVPYSTFLARRQAVLNQQAALFGTGSTQPGLLWAVGPNRELVGRSTARVPVAAALPQTVRYDHPEELQAWAPDQLWAPSHISGVIDDAKPGQNLALSVNGTIRGVGRTYDFLGKTRFSLMAPESAFHTGANNVHVYAVTGTAPNLRLSPLGE